MHRGCFVWTPTPPLPGGRTPRPAPVRVCVCSSVLAGSGGPASRARFSAPHRPRWVCPGLGPLFSRRLLFCFVFFSVSPLFFSLRPLYLLLFLVSGPGCPEPWRFVLFVLLASRFLALRALLLSLCCLAVGRSPVVAPPPPSLSLLLPFLVALRFFCFFPLACAPLFLAFCLFRPRVPRALALVCVCCARLSVLCAVFFSLGSSCTLAFFVSPGWPLVAAPPPLLCLAVFVVFARCLGFFFLLLCAPVVSGLLWFPAPGALGLGTVFCLFVSASRCPALRARSPRLCLPLGRGLLPRGCCPPPPPSPFVSPRFRRSCSVPWFFFLPLCAPVVSGFLWFLAPGALGLGAVRCLLCWPSASRLSVRSRLFRAFRLAVGCSLVVDAPPPPFVSRGFRRCRSVLCAVCCAVLCVPGCRAAPRCCALCRPVWCSRVLCCFVAPVWCRCLLRHALWRCPLPWGPVLCGAVFCGVPSCCVLCAVCVLPWRGGACCCLPLCFVLCVSRGAVLCVPCPLRSVRCCASLCLCACVVLFVWCVLLLAPGAVLRCCVLCCFLWYAVVRCWVWWPVVVCWWCVSVSVSLSDRVVCFAVVGVMCCGALLPCVVCCGAVLSRGAVLLCSAVVLRCCWGLFCPPVACRAVLCCAVGWLCCLLPGGGVCVLWCSFPRAVRSLSSPLCALRCLVVLAVVPCFPVSCAVALCCHVVLCCRALLSVCGAVCVCFALLWPVVRRRAVLCCAVGCLCCFLPGGGVCVLWCPFPPCWHALKTSVILHVTPRWWRCRGWLALVVAVSRTWRRVRSTCSEREAKASRVGHGREGKVHGE